jgi:hypothetical protein
MPQFVVAALAALGASTAVIVAAEVISTVVLTIALTKIEQLFTGKPSAAPPPPLNVTQRGTTQFRSIVLGTVRCAGSVVFYQCAGANNQYLFMVIAYAGHQCDAVGDAFIDARNIPAADINGTTGAVATSGFNGKIHIWTHLGTDGQTVDAQLTSFFSSIWDSNHKLRGICYRVFQLERDDTAWPNGVPSDFNSVVSGAKLYDPRKDSTNGGSGSHLRTDPSTWEFSVNAALAVRWYLSGGSVTNDITTRTIKYGLKETDARIDDAYVIAAANHSDESLSGANAPPSGAQKRYVVGIECSAGQTRRDILTELIATLGTGQLAYVHGTWRLYAGAYDAPSHSFTQDDLFGDMEISDTTSATDRYNTVCAAYVDALQLYQAATTIYRTNSAYVTQDNGETIQKTITCRGVTNAYRAQRIAELAMRASRLMRTVKFRFGRKGMKVATWETFTMSHKRYGWTNRVFRCVDRQLEYQDDGAVIMIITGKSEDSGVYTDLLTADYTTGTSVTSAIQSEIPDAPLSLTATALGGQNVRFDWTLAPFWQLNGISELWEASSGQPFANASLAWTGRATTAVLTFGDTTTRAYWVRIRTAGGQVSGTYPSGTGIAGAADTVDTIDITGNAATDVFVAVDSSFNGPASVAGSSSFDIPGGTLGVGPNLNCGVIYTLMMSCYQASGSIGDLTVEGTFQNSRNPGPTFDAVQVTATATPMPLSRTQIVCRFIFDNVSGGPPVAWQVGARVFNHTGGSLNFFYGNRTHTIEFIKR